MKTTDSRSGLTAFASICKVGSDSPLTQLTAMSFTTQEPAVHVAVRPAGWPEALAGLNIWFLSLHWAMHTYIAAAAGQLQTADFSKRS